MPKLVAEAAGEERRPSSRIDGQVGWVCPTIVDADAVARLRSQSLQMPLPWVFDWSSLQSIDAEACARMSELFRGWINEPLDMRWLGGDRLMQVLQDAAPTGVRDADPVFWQLRLDALRMANRADQFDEAAIDYCVTYEVSPPSWERAKCRVRIGGEGSSTNSPATSTMQSEAQSTFLDTSVSEASLAMLELMGQLNGDISDNLRVLSAEVGDASIINISCTKLIRLDFMAAGDLLNWVLQRRSENRMVVFNDAHRLVALFFGAMGINEHAKVKVRIN